MTEGLRRETAQTGALIGGRYRICEEIGAGGFGRVFRAEHVALHRPVALKLLSGALRNTHLAGERFRREAFASGRLSHVNCVDVIDFAEGNDGELFMVMELLEGRALTDAIAEGPMPAPRALHIVRHVLAGLEHAHSVGIVHRDIKPGNVFLVEHDGDRDFAKIFDFGIAKLVGDAVTAAGGNDLTQDGFAVGSPTYMSPEQATATVIDGRSDLYSVTVLLFELLTGRPPFHSEDKLAVLGMHMSHPPPRLGDVLGSPVPAGLEALLADGLAKPLDARIATAAAYIARIDALLRGETGASIDVDTRPSPRPRTPSSTRRRWGWAAGLAVLALVGAAAIPGSFDGNEQAPAVAASPATSELSGVAGASERLEAITSDDDVGDDAPVKLVEPEAAAPVMTRADTGELAAIDRLIARGQRRAAKKRLLVLQPGSTDASVSMRLGHLYIRDMWWAEGFSAYRRAFALDPSLRSDERVIKNAIRSLMSRRRPGLGERFLVEEIGAAAVPELGVAAKRSSSTAVRRRAARLLERLDSSRSR